MTDMTYLMHARFVAGVRQIREQLSDRGASMVEYSLLVALIALVSIAALGVLGRTVSSDFSDINSDITAATNP